MMIKLYLALLAVCSLIAPTFAQNRVLERRSVQPISPTPTRSTNENVLPIRRVILYSNGVAYIERRGTVSGSAEVNLSFKQSQVDDVLKSMVVLDLGAGRIGAVSYNSSAPPAARMAEIPFSVDAQTNGDAGGIAGVLAQLQGARVAVASTKGAATGVILTIEKRTIKIEDNKPPIETRFLVIASETGELSSFDLNEVRSVKLLDEGTQKDVREFASATASARRRDAKTITVTSEGAGAREMVVSYTIAAPIWKTTYRVVLDEVGKPFFQGWAIVDNVSEEDWRNVQLSLVSGSPISFIQPLQNPLFRHRPVIAIPENLSLEPQIYDPAVGSGQGSGRGVGVGYGSRNGIGDGIGEPPPPAVDEKVTTEVSDLLSGENSGVETAAVGAKLGDLFEYQIQQAVTVERNRSALIPIVQTKMEGERVSVYREPETDENAGAKERPMSGILLKNTTALTFESGALTVLERNAYAGEALMERLKSGENRIIGFALDLETLVDVKREQEREPAKLVKAVDGNFQVHYFKTDKRVYKIQNQTERARTVFVEHPITEKWTLSDDTAKPAEITANHYRFRIELKPFETVLLPITERQGLMDSYVLRNLNQADVELFVRQNSVSGATKQKLEQLINLRANINRINEQLKTLENEIKIIAEDQKRFRENIEALAKTPEAKQLIGRYIAKANEQETRLEQIAKERQTLQTEQQRMENELAALIRVFDV